MIGTNLNLDLPSLSDPLATIVSKLVTAVDQIQDSLADKATQAAFNITGPLDLSGNALTDITSVQFAEGNYNQLPGAMFYALGEFFVTDATGIIQVTKNGALNITSSGGFTGDYGAPGVTAAAEYSSSAQEYRFTDAPGNYSDIVCDDVVLRGTAGTVRLGVDAAITTGRTISVKSLPVSGVSLLAYDASTSTLEDGATKTITGTQNFTNVKVAASGDYKHDTVRTKWLPIFRSAEDFGVQYYSRYKVSFDGTPAAWDHWRPITCVRAGDHIVDVILNFEGVPAGGGVSIDVRRYVPSTGVESVMASASINPAGGTFTQTINVDTTVGLGSATEQWIIYFHGLNGTGVTGSGGYLRGAAVTWTHP